MLPLLALLCDKSHPVHCSRAYFTEYARWKAVELPRLKQYFLIFARDYPKYHGSALNFACLIGAGDRTRFALLPFGQQLW